MVTHDIEAIHRFNTQNNLTKALQTLHGICAGLSADGELNDHEIRYLRLWLREHEEISHVWPASVITQRVQDALADGVISLPERAYLLKTLSDLSGNDFTASGTATPVGPTIPASEDCPVVFAGQLYCFTGNFIYGTRSACEKVVMSLDAMCAARVTRKLNYLVVGALVSADWFNTTYGRKIEKAAELKSQGHMVHIITEKRWSGAIPAHR